jgi:hypothetical protein
MHALLRISRGLQPASIQHPGRVSLGSRRHPDRGPPARSNASQSSREKSELRAGFSEMCSRLADQSRRLQRIYCAAILNLEGCPVRALPGACSSAKDDNAPRFRLIRFWQLLSQTFGAASRNPVRGVVTRSPQSSCSRANYPSISTGRSRCSVSVGAKVAA